MPRLKYHRRMTKNTVVIKQELTAFVDVRDRTGKRRTFTLTD